ncbi:Putative zinc transporter msc2 [Hypoxylon texense]
MGRPPAYIFIVRHGKRLDAADKQWHLSSPTPYDPPLTYGGWLQSRTVGARIASILQQREAEDEALANSQGPDTAPVGRKKKHYKVIIHSSPFLRCVQTSIAIASGLASSPPLPAATEGSHSPRSTQPHSPSSAPARPRPIISTQIHPPHDPSSSVEKSVLRLDPFLGEWLSPDYFEHITPPPRSSLMLVTAKAELLRRENYNDYPHFHTRHAPNGNGSPQLWNAPHGRGSPLASSMTPDSDAPSGLDSVSNLKSDLPRIRSESVGTMDPRAAYKLAPPNPTWTPGYVSPVPSYALSTSEPIPRGYVAHARDACIDVDYQWDSTRENLGWGDGGVLPEEWAAMHQRFRKGLRRLVEWYSTTENPGEMVTKTASSPKSSKSSRRGSNEDNHSDLAVVHDSDVEIENVVVLVSHGAGCNALIGAITQQPVLIDVGMSSITMAERKPEFDNGFDFGIYDKPASSLEEALVAKRTMLSEMFEIKLFANTEHLHSTTPPTLSRNSSGAGRNPHGLYSSGLTSALKEAIGGATPGSRSNSVNASLGSMRRGSPVLASSSRTPPNGTIVNGGNSALSSRPSLSTSTGLWAPPGRDDGIAEEAAETSLRIDVDHEVQAKTDDNANIKPQKKDSDTNKADSVEARDKTTSKNGSQTSQGEEHDQFDEATAPRLWAGTGVGNGGLWGAPRPPGEAERIRDFSSTKRRWTVNER